MQFSKRKQDAPRSKNALGKTTKGSEVDHSGFAKRQEDTKRMERFHMSNYRPLPDTVYLKHSEIDGMGLFAKEQINSGHEFGITHVADARFENGYIRTPLGGFFNHSESPNCEAYIKKDYICLRSLREIDKDEEITVKYWLYKIIME